MKNVKVSARFLAALFSSLIIAACSAPPDSQITEGPPCSCSMGATRCRSGQVQVCEQTSASCNDWGPTTACPEGTCAGERCNANCQDTCAAGSARCADDSNQEICRIGPSGCFEWAHKACAAQQYCSPQTLSCTPAIPCDPSCPSGYTCLPTGVCAGGTPTGLVLDVKTVKVSGRVTLNGATPLAGADCTGRPDDYTARVIFHENTRGYSFELYALCKDNSFTFQGVVFPGTYSVSIAGGHYSQSSNLPAQAYQAMGALAINTDLSGVALDVKTVQASGRVTLNGAAPLVGADCTGRPDDYTARVIFRENTRGYSFELYALCKDSSFTFKGPLFPGTYSVAVAGGHYSQSSNLPNQAYYVDAALVVSADLSGKVFDIKTVKASGRVTLNGAAPLAGSDCLGRPDDYAARVIFRENTRGYSFELYALCKDTSFAFQGVLFPGTYSVAVSGGHYSQSSNLPNQAYYVDGALVVNSDLSGKVFDVKTVTVGGRLTLNGAAPMVGTDCAGRPTDYSGRAMLRETTRGYTFELYTLCQDTSFAFLGPIFPGTYSLTVLGGHYSQSSNLPQQGYQAEASLVINTNLAGKVLDVKTVTVDGRITLNGAPPLLGTDCTGRPDDYTGRVTLRETTRGYSFDLYSLCKDSSFVFQGPIFPGTYSLAVAGGHYSQSSNLPNQGFQTEAALVIGANLSGKVLDVKTVTVGGRITLNGAKPLVGTDCTGRPDDYTGRAMLSETTLGYSFELLALCKDNSFSFQGPVYPGTYSISVMGGHYSQSSNLPNQGFVAVSQIRL